MRKFDLWMFILCKEERGFAEIDARFAETCVRLDPLVKGQNAGLCRRCFEYAVTSDDSFKCGDLANLLDAIRAVNNREAKISCEALIRIGLREDSVAMTIDLPTQLLELCVAHVVPISVAVFKVSD